MNQKLMQEFCIGLSDLLSDRARLAESLTEVVSLRAKVETLRREREELLAAINKFLSDNNPEGFGCACEPDRFCGPCLEAKRQEALYAAIAKVKP